MSEKKNRLFAVGECTDEVVLYCGGPDVEDALKGLSSLLECSIECLLHDGGSEEIELRVIPMTDEEVENLPDGG
jgi:hypothetical protein